jgi:uroporphyrin-III C-methyltransferase/precorrin-2 dehydrogenase/sirohydrochlorin ferrochelatase
VGGGPGAEDLITLRGWRLLRAADVVVTDRLAPRGLLAELDDDVEIVDAGKTPYRRSMAQSDINRVLIERAEAGARVVRLKGGDPFVFGRGGEEVLACVAAGVPVEVVPGVTSAIAGPGLAGIPVTHRGVAQSFSVVSAHVPPGDPASTVDWAAVAADTGTLVLLMAVERLDLIAKELLRLGKPEHTPAAVVQDASLPSARAVFADLGTIAARVQQERLRAPAVVVIGPVVGVLPAVAAFAAAPPADG